MISEPILDRKRIEKMEEEQHKRNTAEELLLPRFHLAPPTGWLNDPNGLCQLQGMHHIFFQYSPYDAKGADKYWGHYETKDFIHYRYTGVFLSPDSEADRDGVYSGCAYTEDNTMYFYYTGNVKEEGDYDYVYAGRGANTILVTSKDGKSASSKRTLLSAKDYPERLSCHIRDPKVWRERDSYYMVLGARTREDQGTVLLYSSSDRENWQFVRYLETREPFGYMWECPDLFTLQGKRILSLSPQGLTSEEYRYQNMYQSGYFFCRGDASCPPSALELVEAFTEWDLGFDFYAPQTYLDEAGRRILIGWMGVPDAPYDHDPSIEKGWQHMLTIPRELSINEKNGRIRQWPVEEITSLREKTPRIFTRAAQQEEKECDFLPLCYEALLEEISGDSFTVRFDDALELTYRAENRELSLHFTKAGHGREERKALMNEPLSSLRILVDTCCVEIFVNRGDYVMTTKFFVEKDFSAKRRLNVNGCCQTLTVYGLKAFTVE